MIPSGKTMYIWKIKDVHNGANDPLGLADKAKQAGYTALLVKAANGADIYNLRMPGSTDTIVKPLVDACHKIGIKVFGWQYVYGVDPVAEGKRAIERLETCGFDGWVVDPEKEFKKAGMGARAEKYLDTIWSALWLDDLGLTTYRYPSLHMEFPWQVFMTGSTYYMPQVYWVGSSNPAEQLSKSLIEYRGLEKKFGIHEKPFVPLGSAYREFYTVNGEPKSWQPTPDQIKEFHDKALSLGLQGESFWEWGSAIRYPPLEATVNGLIWQDQALPPLPEPCTEYTVRLNAILAKVPEAQDILNEILKLAGGIK